MKFHIWAILKWTVHSHGKFIHIVVQLLLLSFSRTCSSSQTETLCPWNTSSPFSYSQGYPQVTPLLLSGQSCTSFPNHKDQSETRMLFLNYDMRDEALLLAKKIFVFSAWVDFWVSLHTSAFTAFLCLSLRVSLLFCFEFPTLQHTLPTFNPPFPVSVAYFHTLWSSVLSARLHFSESAPVAGTFSLPPCSKSSSLPACSSKVTWKPLEAREHWHSVMVTGRQNH